MTESNLYCSVLEGRSTPPTSDFWWGTPHQPVQKSLKQCCYLRFFLCNLSSLLLSKGLIYILGHRPFAYYCSLLFILPSTSLSFINCISSAVLPSVPLGLHSPCLILQSGKNYPCLLIARSSKNCQRYFGLMNVCPWKAFEGAKLLFPSYLFYHLFSWKGIFYLQINRD